MTKGTILTCPECGYTYEQVNDEVVYCTGRREGNKVGHKKGIRMVEK